MPIVPKYPKNTIAPSTGPCAPAPEPPLPNQSNISPRSGQSANVPTKPPKKERGPRHKKQATGDHPVGYCRPPKDTRFDGSRPGPGRPKGSVSQDTLLRKHLDKKLSARIDGKQQRVSQRELAVLLRIKQALEERKKDALDFLLREAGRLYPDATVPDGSTGQALSAEDYSILDALLDQLGASPRESDDSGETES